MLISRDFLDGVGLMSEDYFLYGEEIDWATRAKGTFLQSLLSMIRSVPETKLITLAVGVCMILILTGVEHFAPKAPAPATTIFMAGFPG